MTAQLSPTPIFKGWANDGTPLAYGLLYTWAAGTTSPQATYTDSTGGTPNTNPIGLDARGECALWLSPALSYKFNLTDLNGNQISRYPVDNITNVVDSLNVRYDITPAEITAGVTPTNYYINPATGSILRYGADPTGIVPCDTVMVNAIAVQQANGGGTIQLPPGTLTFTGGNVFALTKPLRIQGAGNATSYSPGGTAISHTGNNTCFDFTANASLVAATTLEDLHVLGNSGSSAIFANFSDSYGNTIRRITVENYTAGICIQLWNKLQYTEGFVAEDWDLRQFAAGFNFKPTQATGGTNSFFGFQCRNVEMVPGGNGSGFLMNSNSTNGQLVVYASKIGVNYSIIAGGSRLFFVGGYSVFTQSQCWVGQDGTPTVDGSDNYTFFQYSPAGAADPNGGYINVDCKFKPSDFYSTSALASGSLIKIQNEAVFSSQQSSRSGVSSYLGQPNARVRGATVFFGDTAQTINKTLTVSSMQPGTKYKAMLHCYATGGALINDATYEIDNYDVGVLSSVTKLAGIDSSNAKCQVFGGGTGGAGGTGLCFDILIEAATIGVSTSWTLELEMM